MQPPGERGHSGSALRTQRRDDRGRGRGQPANLGSGAMRGGARATQATDPKDLVRLRRTWETVTDLRHRR